MDTPSYPPPPAPLPPTQPAPTKSSGYALASLILGIFSMIGGLILMVPPILAIVFGHLSVSQCSKDRALTGKGMGIAGLVMGYVSLVLMIPGLLAAMAIPAFTKVRSSSQDKAVINNCRQLSAAADQYFLENGVTAVRFNDLIGTDKYIKTFHTVAGEKYPERFTLGITITVQGVAGTRTVTYVP